MSLPKRQDVGQYSLLYTLGVGSTGKVKLAEHRGTHKQYAMKIIKKSIFEHHPDLQDKTRREIALMRLMEHPHILKIIEILESQKHLYLVLEFASHGELFDYLASRGSLPIPDAMRLFRQIIYGLDYLHANSICHRDLKLENILLDEFNNVKIADFGFAKWMRSNVAETSCGSPHYAAPEVIKGTPYDGRKSDIWSSGVILYALLTGRLPFEEQSLRLLASKIRGGVFRMPDLPDPVKDLLSKLLTVDPAARISLERIKRHPAVREGIPRRFACPTPLPMPSVMSPIEPGNVDEEVLRLLRQVGFRSDEELFADLRSHEGNLAKVFCIMLANRMDMDTVPWPTEFKENEEAVVVDADLRVEHEPLNYSFETATPFVIPGHGNEESASVYSLAEKASWDPRNNVDVVDASKNVSNLSDIAQPMEFVVAAMQQALNESGFDWFYPNDLLILARRQQDKTDVIVNIECQTETTLKVALHFLQGNVIIFNDLVASVIQGINDLSLGENVIE